jgi:hypothetical protein
MAVAKPFTATKAALGGGLSMIVVERRSKTNSSIVELKTAADAQVELKKAWNETLQLISNDSNLVAYSPDLVMRVDDPRVAVMSNDLASESEIVAAVLADSDRGLEAPKNVAAEHLYLYALVSDTKAGRVAMIKKRTPAKRAREGKWWALAEKELRLIEDDPWQIYPTFDLVVCQKGAYVLRLGALDQLLGDSQILMQRIGDWVKAVAASLPIGKGQDAILVERCEESSRLRQRLRAIHSRGHLSRVSIAEVKAHAKRMKLKPADFTKGNKLLITETNVDQLLKLLNEDLFTGGLTGDPFVSGGKEPLR